MFENVCRQYLIRKNKAGEIEPVIENIGKYFYDNPEKRTNGEFDIVTFSRSGFRCEKRDDVVLIALEEIFA